MGRHGRNSPETAAPPRGHRGARRRGSGARTGLLGASAAMAVGAVAVATGLLPAPSGLTGGGFVFGGDDGDPGGHAQAGGSPSALATDGALGVTTVAGGATAGGSGGPAASVSPTTSPTGTARRSAPVVRRATPTPTAVRRAATATASGPAGTGATGGSTASVDEVLTLVNQQRSLAGCRPLTLNSKLTELAQDFSEEMAARGFFDHTDPDGKTPWDRAAALGIGNLGGENIAEGQPDAQAVMTAWMNSPGHRANILNCDYRTIGIGVHTATGSQSGGPWWTQDFGF